MYKSVIKKQLHSLCELTKLACDALPHASNVWGMQLDENPQSGSREAVEKVLWSPSKVPFIINWSQPNLQGLVRMCGKCGIWRLMKIRAVEAEKQWKRYFGLHVKCSQLLTDRNRTYMICSAWVESATYLVLGKSLLWKPRHSRKGTLFF
jgi:hypothetical protein